MRLTTLGTEGWLTQCDVGVRMAGVFPALRPVRYSQLSFVYALDATRPDFHPTQMSRNSITGPVRLLWAFINRPASETGTSRSNVGVISPGYSGLSHAASVHRTYPILKATPQFLPLPLASHKTVSVGAKLISTHPIGCSHMENYVENLSI